MVDAVPYRRALAVRLRRALGRGRRRVTLVVGGERRSARWPTRLAVGGVELAATTSRVRGVEVCRVEVVNRGPAGADVRVRVELEAVEPAPWWLVPGVMYGANRRDECEVAYPRFSADPDPSDRLAASAWAFRADRCAVPVAAMLGERAAFAIATDPENGFWQAGVGFGVDGGRAAAWVDLPFREAPVSYTDHGLSGPADAATSLLPPGERVAAEVRIYELAAGDRHAYADVIRAEHARHAGRAPLTPPMTPTEAAGLAAHGLARWHYHDSPPALWETAAFDRARADEDRAAMHVGWLSGAPAAAPLLEHARRTGDARLAEQASGVLDTVASGLTASGFFWGQWTQARGFRHGWSPHEGWLHARTLAEATLFLARAVRAERARGLEHRGWEAAVRSNLAAARRAQRADGAFGEHYDARTGAVTEWTGDGGLLWVACLAESAAALGEPGMLDAAVLGAAFYEASLASELLAGAPEDVHLCPSSEDGYNAVIAYVALAEATADERWLGVARRAAEWSLTFRLCHDVRFPPDSPLGRLGFRTRGGDVASPANQHLHTYGLVCLPELFRLAERTGDAYLAERAADHLAFALQLLARHDGDFGAMRGMTSERYHHTEWAAPKGALLGLSHAWCLGLLLSACLAAGGSASDAPRAQASSSRRCSSSSASRTSSSEAGFG